MHEQAQHTTARFNRGLLPPARTFYQDEFGSALGRERGGWAHISELMITTRDGAAKAVLANAITVLHYASEWDGVLAFNEFTLHVTTKKSAPWERKAGTNWSDYDDSKTAEWLQHSGIMVSSKVAAEAVQTVARENSFHPVKDYLSTVKWDQKMRLDSWLSTYMGVEQSTFTSTVGARWLISAVARI